ncbi:MAG: Fic family protein [Kordiimonadaceae bacterium]|nr:Fic family protein [Kordiimonadaceae bacterium]MBO6569211.1 Fic family protein [Kordiimonadaceae bacterium]MBO6964687.1 Fic family protein [Kordiimonadaceae bacterium]
MTHHPPDWEQANQVDVRPILTLPPKIKGINRPGSRVLERIANFAQYLRGQEYRCFGNDIYLAGMVEAGKLVFVTPNGFPSASMLHSSPKPLYVRPSAEPIVHEFWEDMVVDQPDKETVRQLGSCLYGAPFRYRTNKLKTDQDLDGLYSVFPNSEDPDSLIDEYWQLIPRQASDTLEACLVRYFNFVALHPFSDGNGRTARALLMADLARTAECSFVYLPLAVVKRVWLPLITEAERRLSLEREAAWADYVALMIEMLDTALGVAEASSGLPVSGDVHFHFKNDPCGARYAGSTVRGLVE